MWSMTSSWRWALPARRAPRLGRWPRPRRPIGPAADGCIAPGSPSQACSCRGIGAPGRRWRVGQPSCGVGGWPWSRFPVVIPTWHRPQAPCNSRIRRPRKTRRTPPLAQAENYGYVVPAPTHPTTSPAGTRSGQNAALVQKTPYDRAKCSPLHPLTPPAYRPAPPGRAPTNSSPLKSRLTTPQTSFSATDR